MTGPVFEFRYGHFGNRWIHGIAAVAIFAIVFSQGIRIGVPLPLSVAYAAGTAGLAVAGYAALHLFPHTIFGKRLVVSSEGARIWRTVLPAHRIAEVATVDEAVMADRRRKPRKAGTGGLGREVQGRRVATLRFFYPWTEDLPAVLVRDKDGGEWPWWVYAAPKGVDVEEFAAAIRSIAPSLEESDRGD